MNVELCDALLERQSESHVVERISDILLQHVGNFEPFVVYGSHQMVAKHMFELEKTRNPKFAEFVYVSLISPLAFLFFLSFIPMCLFLYRKPNENRSHENWN